MTYHMNPEVGKIVSPIRLVLPGEELSFSSGTELAAYDFESMYVVKSIRAVEGTIEITEAERESGAMTWVGEESVSLFDG